MTLDYGVRGERGAGTDADRRMLVHDRRQVVFDLAIGSLAYGRETRERGDSAAGERVSNSRRKGNRKRERLRGVGRHGYIADDFFAGVEPAAVRVEVDPAAHVATGRAGADRHAAGGAENERERERDAILVVRNASGVIACGSGIGLAVGLRVDERS